MKKVHDELKLDHHFWNAISTNSTFREWFLDRTKFSGLTLELVTTEKWHQRWYRDPITKKDSETDILLMLCDLSSGLRYAVHVENKPDHRNWENLQAENYRRRAINRMTAWRYVDFQTVLIAPKSFLSRFAAEAEIFDVAISYEDIAAFVPEFAPVT